MIVNAAEDAFRRGLQYLARGNAREALALFAYANETGCALRGAGEVEARYLSYHGLCLCLTRSGTLRGLSDCREAAQRESYRPDLWGNLARAALAAGRRRESYQALRRGLAIDPGHAGMLATLRRLGVRRRPALPFLARNNPFNVLLGRLRGAGHSRKAQAASAAALVLPR